MIMQIGKGLFFSEAMQLSGLSDIRLSGFDCSTNFKSIHLSKYQRREVYKYLTSFDLQLCGASHTPGI